MNLLQLCIANPDVNQSTHFATFGWMSENNNLVQTGDGSTTLLDKRTGDHYHSLHGAENEGRHVFIEHGLVEALKLQGQISLLEIGTGTGLNVMLTLEAMSQHSSGQVIMDTLEPFPVEMELIRQLKFSFLNSEKNANAFFRLHESGFNQVISLHENLTVRKHKKLLQDFTSEMKFNLVYYDAFGPRYQAEMWTVDMFNKVWDLMEVNGMMVTYCAQGAFKRNLKEAGFQVESLPGPPGKREMTRSRKII